MRVALLSMFSTSTGYLDRYFDQVSALQAALNPGKDSVRLILCEGDSKDNTWRQLHKRTRACGLQTVLLQHHHGNKVYGSVEEPARFAQLSSIWNEMLEHVNRQDDAVVIVESDLIWDAETLKRLIWDALTVGGVVAPMVFEQDADYFHDVWAYRRRGRRFTNEPPYHPDLERMNGLMLMNSVGSCLVMPARIARLCRTTEEEELVGFCAQVRETGYSVWVDPGLRIQHPPTGQTGRGVGAARLVEAVRV